MDVSQLARVLKTGIDRFPSHLATLASANGLNQVEQPDEVSWVTAQGELRSLFYVIEDPRDLRRVTRVYERTKEARSPFTYVLVHQWGDGDGNWDIFTIRPTRCMEHRGRVIGSTRVTGTGPSLRDDIYGLFTCGRPFPAPGREAWARLLGAPRTDVTGRLAAMAFDHGCSQEEDVALVWHDSAGVQAMFHVLPDPQDLAAFVNIYHEIARRECPVTFVFVAQDQPLVYDIFRLSARSYLEHHNQAR